MTIGKIEETHVRKCRVVIERRDLESIIKDHVLKLTGFTGTATSVTLQFHDATEGSLAYKVGTQCIADLIEDQTQLPRTEAANAS